MELIITSMEVVDTSVYNTKIFGRTELSVNLNLSLVGRGGFLPEEYLDEEGGLNSKFTQDLWEGKIKIVNTLKYEPSV